MELLSPEHRKKDTVESSFATRAFRNGIRELLYEKTKRRPMILTNITHIDR